MSRIRALRAVRIAAPDEARARPASVRPALHGVARGGDATLRVGAA